MKRLIPILLAAIIPAATANLPKDKTAAAPKVATVQTVKNDSYVVPPTAIKAPKTIGRGELVVLDAGDAPKAAGLSQYTYVWVVSPRPNGMLTWPDGSKAFFSSGVDGAPSHYDVTLVANYLFVAEDGKSPVLKTVEATAALDIGTPPPGPTPTPTPVPPPGPTPSPSVPDGKYKIAAVALEIAKNHPADECQALAKAYRTLSASTVGTKAELVNQTVPAIHEALGDKLTSWVNDLNALAAKVNALNVVPVADCKTLYGEIATGLEARK